MFKTFLPRTLVILFVLVLNTTALAQGLYDQEVSELSGMLRALMVRAEKAHRPDLATRLQIQSELLELSKKLHRLEEEALGANVALLGSGRSPDRQLLLAAAICKSLDLAQSLTAHFLDTGDKVFWSVAVQAAQSARNLQAKQ
jgi:hypothetical protein